MKKPNIIQLKQQLAVPDRRLRMIWNSNSIWSNSGYGIAQRDMLTRFIADGWPVAQIAFYGLEGSIIKLNGLTVYPKMADTWGSDAMLFHSKHFNARVVMTMQDIWPLQPQVLQQMQQNNLVWIPYVPIDQEPVPPNILDKLQYAYKIITFSEFGQKALEKKGFTSTLIKEGTDTNIFKPMDKKECRAAFGLPQDAFIFGMVGANKDNPPRKGWQEALDAFKLFHDKHPEALFFFQTNQPLASGFPIAEYARMLGITDNVVHLDDYLAVYHTGSEVMAKLYNAFDVLLHPSLTEGFGLCVIEAMSCGTPVIVNNCTSMPEMVIPGVTGEICEIGRKHLSPAMGYFYFADVDSLVEKMEKLYAADRVKIGQQARAHVVANYNIDTIVKEKWIPLFLELQKELLPDPLQTVIDKVQSDQLNTPT